MITNRFVSILIKSPLELLRGWDKIGIGTSLGRAAPLWRASSSSSNSAELDKTSKFPLAAIQQTNGLP